MAIFRRFLADLLPLVPTVHRRRPEQVWVDDGTRTSQSAVNLLLAIAYQFFDAVTAAQDEYITTSWPIDTASRWVLDLHWGPYHDLDRNGLSDADYRVFIHAKRLLNKSWGAADQALEIFDLLLPTATLTWVPHYPKAWEVVIAGVDMATAAAAVNFMEKKPSPEGGGFSVCGDNGYATTVDPFALNYGSVYGVMGVDYQVTGWYGSVYGAGGGQQAGHAHVTPI